MKFFPNNSDKNDSVDLCWLWLRNCFIKMKTICLHSSPHPTLQHSLSYLTDSCLVAAAPVTRPTRFSRLFFSRLRNPYQAHQSAKKKDWQLKASWRLWHVTPKNRYDVIMEVCTLVYLEKMIVNSWRKEREYFAKIIYSDIISGILSWPLNIVFACL